MTRVCSKCYGSGWYMRRRCPRCAGLLTVPDLRKAWAK